MTKHNVQTGGPRPSSKPRNYASNRKDRMLDNHGRIERSLEIKVLDDHLLPGPDDRKLASQLDDEGQQRAGSRTTKWLQYTLTIDCKEKW